MKQQAATEKFSGKEFFLLPDGSTYHLGTKRGEVAQRIVTVGSRGRAQAFASLLDAKPEPLKIHSNRDMTTITGNYKGVQVSIIAIGMGAPMMDFMVREVAYCQPGKIACVRVGTCGLFNPALTAGTVCTAGRGSSYCYTNYARFAGCANWRAAGEENAPHYLITKPIAPDAELNKLLVEGLKSQGVPHHDGLNISGETFYSCQGRVSSQWESHSDNLVEQFEAAGVDSCEMELHQLLHAASVRKDGLLRAAGCAIGIVSRTGDSGNITDSGLVELELKCGRAALEAVTNFALS